MKTIFNASDYAGIEERINRLTPSSPALWGKMNVAQMLAHCSATVEMALGDVVLKRLFIGRIIGPLVKKKFLGEEPFKQGNPTAREFTITDPRDFEKEKQRLLGLMKRLHEGGEAGATKHPHGFFGPLTPAQWGQTQWKHFDHHLRQFGV
ncbi:MAG TPA: DUF1569 domain-containing protein [Bacteroidia bacterium]|nr:DUF1569 domain-containing protein [Bacteroidia bacterium]